MDLSWNHFYNKTLAFVLMLVIGASCTKPMPVTPEQEAKLEKKVQSLLVQATKFLRGDSKDSELAAFSKLKIAYELSPDDPRVLDALGCLYWKKGDLNTAYSYFKQATQINNYYDRGYAHMALIAEERKEYREAENLYQLAIQMNPLNFRTRNNYALMLRRINSDPNLDFKASSEYLKAIASRD